MKPIILVTPRIEKNMNGIPVTYSNAVKREGGLPISCSYNNIDEIDYLLDIVDGILFTGGADIHPDYYGYAVNENNYGMDKERDEYEINLCKKAIQKNLPILGICRGHQLINVALGGTLKQHVRNHMSEIDGITDEEKGEPTHSIDFVPNSYFQKIFGTRTLNVNSFHHQVIDKLADGIEMQAYSSEKYVEAAKYNKCDFVISVQFHPEIMVKYDEQRTVFKKLLEASSIYKLSKRNNSNDILNKNINKKENFYTSSTPINNDFINLKAETENNIGVKKNVQQIKVTPINISSNLRDDIKRDEEYEVYKDDTNSISELMKLKDERKNLNNKQENLGIKEIQINRPRESSNQNIKEVRKSIDLNITKEKMEPITDKRENIEIKKNVNYMINDNKTNIKEIVKKDSSSIEPIRPITSSLSPEEIETARKSTAKKLTQMGFSIEEIMKITSYTKEEIEEIANSK